MCQHGVRPQECNSHSSSLARTRQWSDGYTSWQAPPLKSGQRCGRRTEWRCLNLPGAWHGLQNRGRLNCIFNFSFLLILRPTQTAPIPTHTDLFPPSPTPFFSSQLFPETDFSHCTNHTGAHLAMFNFHDHSSPAEGTE